MKKNILITLIILVLLATAATIYIFFYTDRNTPATPTVSDTTQEAEHEVRQENEASALETAAPSSSPGSTVSELENTLKAQLAGYSGTWSVYVKNLKTDETVVLNDAQMTAASLIKLVVMAKVFDAEKNGEVQKSDKTADMLSNMITVSSNSDANNLIKLIGNGNAESGMSSINEYASKQGLSSTRLLRLMQDSHTQPPKVENLCSVSDCGKLLYQIYKKELVSPEASEQMLSFLLKQTRTSKIPHGVPPETKVANKTGELPNVENDVAIVFSPSADYILCVMSDKIESSASAQKNISEISKTVYSYYN